MEKTSGNKKRLLKGAWLLATLPLSFIPLLIIKQYHLTDTLRLFAILWPYTFLIIGIGMTYYRRQMEEKRLEMKTLVKQERLINSSLVLINTEEKLKNVLSLEIERCSDKRERSALIFFDIDELGEINQRFGYDVGDAVIIEIIKASKALIEDIDHFGRIKGDTFAVVFPSKTKDHAYAFAKALNSTIKDIEKRLGVLITCRFVAMTIDGWNTDDRVLAAAYEQLETAKEYGRGVIM